MAEAEADLEDDAEGAAVVDRLAEDEDDDDDAGRDDEELAAAEVVVVVLDVNLPKTDILYHPPHFWLALPAQLLLHWLSVTMSVDERVPQKHSFPF